MHAKRDREQNQQSLETTWNSPETIWRPLEIVRSALARTKTFSKKIRSSSEIIWSYNEARTQGAAPYSMVASIEILPKSILVVVVVSRILLRLTILRCKFLSQAQMKAVRRQRRTINFSFCPAAHITYCGIGVAGIQRRMQNHQRAEIRVRR